MSAGLLLCVAVLAVVAAALTTCIYLFVTLKRECLKLRRSAEAATASNAIALQRLEARLAQVERELEGAPALPAGASGMNLNRRTQALRMMRNGEAPERIAAVLSLPVKEVELLSRVNQIATGRITFSRPGQA